MRKLTCSDCGGTLKVSVNGEGMAIGTCAYCQAEYLLDRRRKQYVVVEHRYAPSARPPGPAPAALRPSRRRLLLGLAAGGGIAALVTGALRTPLRGGGDARAPAGPGARVVFITGSRGAGPGQFRDRPSAMAIDGHGRAVIMDSNDRLYVFDAEGGFLAGHPKPEGFNMLVALLPGGDLILHGGWPGRFGRYDPLEGRITEVVELPDDDAYAPVRVQGAVTPNGGFAVYGLLRDAEGVDPGLPLPDAVTFYGRNLRERRRLTGLMTQAVAADPMVQGRPEVSSLAINGAGNIFLNLQAREDTDSRGGVFEFNADGVFQRRIAVEQGIWGDLAASPDGSLWYGDAWVRDLQRIIGPEVQRIGFSGLAEAAGQGIGNCATIAAYPNGDIGLATLDDQLIRVALAKA